MTVEKVACVTTGESGKGADADRYAVDGIRMNTVLPGLFDSLPASDGRRDRRPMKRYGRTEAVSSLIACIACRNSTCMIGRNLYIDGGLTRAF